jgi:succinyl-CoA synthetase beta subunit
VPVVVRLTGTNEAEGQAILSKAKGLIPAAGMAEAAQKVVEAVKGKQ